MPDMPDLPVIHTPIPIRPPPTAIPLPQSPAPESELSHASSSLAPSQSASQVGTITQSSSAPLHDHIYSNLEAQSGTTASPAPVPASPLKRHTLPHRITEEDLHQSTSSDDDGEEPVRVVENPRYRNGLPNHEPFTSSPKKDKGGLFGSIRGLFHRHSKDGSSSSVGRDDDQESVSVGRGRGGRRIPLFGAGGKKNSTHRWDDESPVRPVLPTRRVSEDIVPTTFPPVRDRVMSMSDVSPVSGNTSPSGKKLKKKGEMKAIAEETRGKKKKAKRRRSASLDPGVLREPNEAEDIVDLGRKEKESSLVRAGEWVDSQKRQETPPERKPSVKKKKQSGVGSGLISAASASTPVLPASWSVPESWAVNDVTIVPVEGGGLSKSSSTRSRVQSTVATPSGPKAPRHTRSSSTERIPTSSTMPAITLTHTTATTTKAQKRASAPVTFSNGSTSLMSIVEDVTRANRETWSTGGSSPGLVKSVGGTVKPSALVEVKAPRSLSAKDLEGVDVFSVSKEVNSSSSLFLPKAPSIPKENGSVRSLPLPGKSVATVTQQQQPVVQQRPSSVSPEQRKPVVPLRSALKGSRTPSPAQPQPQPSAPPQPEAFTSQLSPSSPQPIEGLPVTMNGKGKDVDSDTDSISSYETGHEVPVPVDAPPIPIISPPPHVTPSRSSPPPPPPPPHRQNGLTIPVPPSDLSASSSSTVHQGEKPKRRKSVRVSLKPQFSPTPPAVDDDGEPSWYENENEAGDGPYAPQPHDQNQHQNRHENHEIQKVKRNRDYERDMWQDSSEEEENGEYASARKLLMRGFLRGKKDAKS
ncbi:hypothetical protein L218DRAFT_715848 [Marasmius fiardii PR-910]|nr:hypothetical protein L218DRAFT_715848 [Marasmius fiardii PR-910]